MSGNREAQKEAYDKRSEIKVGDKFLWYFKDGYGTSGSLSEDYMPLSDKFCNMGKTTMTVCKVYESRNGYGKYVDYWLSVTGKEEKDKCGFFDGIIINGVDAFEMERMQ